MSVERALALWPVLQETGLRLGSPACVHPDNKWMKAFTEGAKMSKLKVDFIERYAWFPSNVASNALYNSLLYGADGKLTRLGECYWSDA